MGLPDYATSRRLCGTAASDEALMAEFRATGRETALEALFRRHLAPAYRTALSILGDAALAEDAVQEAFLRVVRARRTYQPGKTFAAWFYVILRNACRDERRRPRAETAADAAPPQVDPALEPPASLARHESAQAAREAFARLSGPEREVLALRIYSDLSFADIGLACGITEEAAKKRAYRALARLRRALARPN